MKTEIDSFVSKTYKKKDITHGERNFTISDRFNYNFALSEDKKLYLVVSTPSVPEKNGKNMLGNLLSLNFDSKTLESNVRSMTILSTKRNLFQNYNNTW
jgi:hypothetical protein